MLVSGILWRADMDKIDIPSLQLGSGGSLSEVLSTPCGKSHPTVKNSNVLAHLKNRAAGLKAPFRDGRDMDEIDISRSGREKTLTPRRQPLYSTA